METQMVTATKKEEINLAKVKAEKDITIDVTIDSFTNQITLENIGHEKSRGEDKVIGLEGDAVVAPEGKVKWKVRTSVIEEIKIEPKIIEGEFPGDIWDTDPELQESSRLEWIRKVKKGDELLDDITDWPYSMHYKIQGSSKWRTIDPIIRVNK